ncbi:MAG: hypothetical protein MMC23_008008 [Stictis urceolatum]|nr:hypothetical protein [Stictis urceolata]
MATDFFIISSIRYDPELLDLPENTELSASPDTRSEFYMLRYHRDRMVVAAKAFEWPTAEASISGESGLNKLDSALREHVLEEYSEVQRRSPIRIRIDLSIRGELSFTSAPTPAVPFACFFPPPLLSPSLDSHLLLSTLSSFDPISIPSTWNIHLSPDPLTPSLYTTHKTSLRDQYTSARHTFSNSSSNPIPATTEVLVCNTAGEIMEGTLSTPYFYRNGSWVTPGEEAGGCRGVSRRWALERMGVRERTIRVGEIEEGEMVWLSNGIRGWGWGRVEFLPWQRREGGGMKISG